MKKPFFIDPFSSLSTLIPRTKLTLPSLSGKKAEQTLRVQVAKMQGESWNGFPAQSF
jgi:hypothetical protein